MPANVRGPPIQGTGYGWSSQSPVKSGRIHHRRSASSSDHEEALQDLPIYTGLKTDKPKMNNSALAAYGKSMAKQARRKPRRFIVALIGLMVLALLWKTPFLNISGDSYTVIQSTSDFAIKKAMLDLNCRPISRLPSRRKDEKYMAYFPHSGYHNQRISLENALTVSKMLDRTLLIPPVWLGHSIPYIAFDKMYHRVMEARKDGLEHCKDIEASDLTPHECLGGYWDYTIVSWDFLVDLERIAKTQPVVERWNMSYNWLQDNLGIDSKKDMVKIKDSSLYQYKIYDSDNDTTPLDKFQSRINIPRLREDYKDAKLLHFGTLFGTTRLHLLDKQNYATRSLARASMVFKNEYLDKVSNTIRDRLGGDMAYFGIHLRLGDGVFRDNAGKNAQKLFDELCKKKLGLSAIALDRVQTQNSKLSGVIARRNENTTGVGNATDGDQSAMGTSMDREVGSVVSKRKMKEDPYLALPPSKRMSKMLDQQLHPSLKCREPLYTEDELAPLNTPIFLATDSNIPDKDPALKLFFDAFPCIFTLSDFSSSHPTFLNSEPIEAFEELDRLRNEDDGVPLAGFFYPLIDAMVAAKGRDMLGTPGSTFSQFAVDVLHRVYHDWPIVERG